MKSNLLAPVWVFCLVLAAAYGQNSTASIQLPSHISKSQTVRQDKNPEAAIKSLLDSQVEAWNHGNLQGFMDGYWRSAELTFFSGANATKGWEPALQRYQRNYQSAGKEMGKLEFQELRIDVLTGSAAVVTGKWQLQMSDGKQPHGLFTLILKRMHEGWRIVHDHTSSGE